MISNFSVMIPAISIAPQNAAISHNSGNTDFAVALRKVKISNGEFAAFDIDWHICFTSTGQVLDVAISTYHQQPDVILPCSRGGTVLAPSRPIFAARSS